MNLILDQGNTSTKIAVFSPIGLVDIMRTYDEDLEKVLAAFKRKYEPSRVFVSSVRAVKPDLSGLFPETRVLGYSPSMPMPLVIDYDTPETLGADRVADAIGAGVLYPGTSCLVIDAGTCITYNLIVKNRFSGGAISPGITMRYRALHTFTGRLPLLKASGDTSIQGLSTASSIHAGVEGAVVLEVEGMIDGYCSEMGPLNVLVTGGDGPFFAQALNCRTFAHPELTLIGLNELLEFNTRD